MEVRPKNSSGKRGPKTVPFDTVQVRQERQRIWGKVVLVLEANMAKIPSRIIHTTPPCNCGLSLKSVWFKSDFFSSQIFSIWGKWRHPVWMVVIDTQGRHTLELSEKDLNWCNSSLLKEGRSQLGWYLNAKARKYLNTTGEDPTKIGRWRDSLRRRTWKGKFVEAWKTCLHPLYLLHPVTANQSQSERSRNRTSKLAREVWMESFGKNSDCQPSSLPAMHLHHPSCSQGVVCWANIYKLILRDNPRPWEADCRESCQVRIC